MRIYHETLYLIGFVIGLIMMIMSIILLLKVKKPKFERLFCVGIILGAIILGGSTVMLDKNILNPIEINRISEQSTEGRTLITMKEKISNMKPGKYTAEMILYDRTTNQPVINDNGEIAKSVFELTINQDIIISEECRCDMDIYVDDIDMKKVRREGYDSVIKIYNDDGFSFINNYNFSNVLPAKINNEEGIICH